MSRARVSPFKTRPLPQVDAVIVIKRRAGEGLGLDINTAGAQGAKIVAILPNSIASSYPNLHVGDDIVTVNGLSVVGLGLAKIVEALVSQSAPLRLGIRTHKDHVNEKPRPRSAWSDDMELSPTVRSMRLTDTTRAVTLLADENGLGLVIDAQGPQRGAIIIDIASDGAAARTDQLSVGDEIIKVGKHSVIGSSIKEVAQLLQRHGPIMLHIAMTKRMRS